MQGIIKDSRVYLLADIFGNNVLDRVLLLGGIYVRLFREIINSINCQITNSECDMRLFFWIHWICGVLGGVSLRQHDTRWDQNAAVGNILNPFP